MHTSLVAIILVSIVIPATDTSPSTSENYRVSEVVRVLSPNSFQCKLHNYKPAPSVRFRVYLSGLDTQGTDGPSKELLTDRLKSAKQIELRNIKLRNYFRVNADLWIDGQPFWEPADIQNKNETDKQPINRTDYQSATAMSWQQPQRLKLPTKRTISGPSKVATIRNLLDTPVDCSMLSDDTPLFEALEILSESVEPHLPLLILWKDLQTNALVEKDMPIGVGGFSRMKLRQAMSIIIRSVSGNGPKLALVSEGNILTLGTEQMLLGGKTTRVYSIIDLLSPPSTGSFYNQGGIGNGSGFGNQNQNNFDNNKGNYFSR